MERDTIPEILLASKMFITLSLNIIHRLYYDNQLFSQDCGNVFHPAGSRADTHTARSAIRNLPE